MSKEYRAEISTTKTKWSLIGALVFISFPLLMILMGIVAADELKMHPEGESPNMDLLVKALVTWVMRVCGGIMFIFSTLMVILGSPLESLPNWFKR